MLDKDIMAIDEEMCIEISKDKMFGIVSFICEKNGGEKLNLDKMKETLEQKGIVAGIDDSALEELSRDRLYHYKYIIAKGVKPTDGMNARVELKFDVTELKEFKPALKEDGTVDFKNLNIVRNVKAGEVLAVKVPSKDGQDGYNILGQVLRAKRGKDIRMPRGKNTKMLEDNLTLVSTIDGKLEYDNYNVYINSVYVLNQDVDNSIGNIDFVGDVIINGSVHSGFTIKAAGNVEVRGNVEDDIIEAGGNVILTYGMQGTSTGKIIAGGNVITKFLQNVEVEAGGDVVTEAILHSNVVAGNSIHSNSGKGTIVGGSVAAGDFIEAKSIGSSMGTVTKIQLGVSAMVYKEYKELGEKVKKSKDNLTKIEQGIKFLMERQQKGSLDPVRKEMLNKFMASKQPIMDMYDELVHKHNILGNKLNNVQDGVVKVYNTIYPGVKIEIGNLAKYIDDPYRRCTIRKIGADIIVS